MQKEIAEFFKPTKKTNIVNKKKDEPISVRSNLFVFTDGACQNNGKPNAIASWAVYFNENDSRNTSELIIGKQTNQVAELTAIIKAYEILEVNNQLNQNITICTDSIYAIRCATTYGEKCEKSCWIKKKPIPNMDLVKKAYYLYKHKNNINFKHIKAHTGRTDFYSLGNDGADKLAVKTINDNQSYLFKS